MNGEADASIFGILFIVLIFMTDNTIFEFSFSIKPLRGLGLPIRNNINPRSACI